MKWVMEKTWRILLSLYIWQGDMFIKIFDSTGPTYKKRNIFQQWGLTFFHNANVLNTRISDWILEKFLLDGEALEYFKNRERYKSYDNFLKIKDKIKL